MILGSTSVWKLVLFLLFLSSYGRSVVWNLLKQKKSMILVFIFAWKSVLHFLFLSSCARSVP